MKKVLRVRNLSWRYPSSEGISDRFAISNVNLDIGQNEFFGITGKSDSGKSTLCAAIAGLIPTQFNVDQERLPRFMRGSVEVCGDTVTRVSRGGSFIVNGSSAPAVGLVSQDPESQFLTMSVKQELSLGLHFMGLGDDEIATRTRHALGVVGLSHLYGAMDRVHPSELSGGQKQRLVIASFLAMRPKLLILDETTSDLDAKGKLGVIETIDRIKREGNMSVILVEQDPEIMLRFANRLGVMNGGRLVKVGKPEEIYANERCVRHHGINTTPAARLLAKRGDRILVGDGDIVGMLRRKAGRHTFEIRKAGEAKHGANIVEAKGLSFSYADGTVALSHVDLEIRKGEFMALLGQNGSGKSTLLRLISGMEGSFGGELRAFGVDLRHKDNRKKMPYNVGYIFQNPEVQIFNRSVYDEIAYGPRNLGMREDAVKSLVKRILAAVRLSDKAHEDPMFLSRGQKRRLAVASVIAMSPKLIIVDEPTTGQDPEMSMNIMELLKELNCKGASVVVVTHDIQLASEYCSRAVVMNRGFVEFDGGMNELFSRNKELESANIMIPQIARIGRALEKAGVVKGTIINSVQLSKFLDEVEQ